MVNLSMLSNDSSMVDERYNGRAYGSEAYPFLLSLLVFFYINISYDFENTSSLIWLWFSRYKFRVPPACSQHHILATNITYT
jgi:hypothetical protein